MTWLTDVLREMQLVRNSFLLLWFSFFHLAQLCIRDA